MGIKSLNITIVLTTLALLNTTAATLSDIQAIYEKYPAHTKLPVIPFQDGFYFFEHTYKLNWHQAGEFCRSHGMHLVSVETEEEDAFVVAEIEQHQGLTDIGCAASYYTSGSDFSVNDTYVWSTTGDRLDIGFTNWAVGEPNNENNFDVNCVAYCVNYQDLSPLHWCLHVGRCTTMNKHFICELLCDEGCNAIPTN